MADSKNIPTKLGIDPRRIDIEVGSDIEIGAVEIKNATTDVRAIVSGAGSLHVLEDNSAAIELVLGTIDTDTGNIVTAVQLLDNVVGVEGAGMVTSGNALILDDGANAILAQANAAGDLKITLGGEVVNVLLANTNDDDSVAFASNDTLVISKMYGSNGADWERLVTDGSGTLTVVEDNSTAILADTAAIQTAVEIMDDWDESDRAKVNLIVGQAGIAAGTGPDGTTVPRVTLATNVGLPQGGSVIGGVFGAAAEDAAASGAPVLSGGRYDLVARTLDTGDVGAIALSTAGHVLTQADGYDSGTDSNKSFEVNPLSEHHVEETVVDVTNAADGGGAVPGGDFGYYFDMDGFRNFGLQLELNCAGGTVTATVEATLQDDGTAAASCAYVDVTNDWFGAASLVAAAGSASAIWIMDTVCAVKYVRLRIDANTGGNSGDWAVYLKKLY